MTNSSDSFVHTPKNCHLTILDKPVKLVLTEDRFTRCYLTSWKALAAFAHFYRNHVTLNYLQWGSKLS